ncbi:hypothetical protein F0P94_03065 [Adhaeribacter soli]|uniref:Outer membrane beta-barrel protein n=2 Tax=Adhaeribacter soli TaxID=2607655 RepID=A0A5N1J5T4_9BACT|nr:hypothetical protein F0P94_03065 [Adhaeribacter soli]
MKKVFSLLLLMAVISARATAQDYANPDYVKSDYRNNLQPASTFYLGFGGGINHYLGLIGPSVEFQLAEKITVFGGAGLGSWGSKLSFGARYYANYPGKWAFGLGYSVSSGLDHIEFDMPEGYVQNHSSTVKVPFKLKSASTVNLSALRFWTLGKARKNRFNVELGYAVSVAEDRYVIKDSNYELMPAGRYFMNVLQPGGVTLGLGFSFGMN